MLTSLHRTGKRFYFFSNLEPRYLLYRNEVGIKLEKQRTSESSDSSSIFVDEREKKEKKRKEKALWNHYEITNSSILRGSLAA